jgi:hypothetical protein
MRMPMTAWRWGTATAGAAAGEAIAGQASTREDTASPDSTSPDSTSPDSATPDSATVGTGPGGAPGSRARRTGELARRHWLLTLLLLAGLVLRVLATVAYRPALLYIDSLKYLYGAWPGNDPLGYNVILKGLLLPGNLTAVAAIQHLLGLGMAVALYAVLLRRGTAHWLAAVAVAPVLLDSYQLQVEQLIMPDVWFEAFIVAGLAALLWRPRPGLRAAVAGGLLLGLSAPVAQVGQILILPALAYLLLVMAGWRRKVVYGAVLCVSFALPIVGFSLREYVVTHHFSLAPAAGSTIYGRLAYSADCATLRLPSDERALCPAPALARQLGPDGLVHSDTSPDHTYVPPLDLTHGQAVGDFEHAVLTQQPLRVVGGILRDAAKLFAVGRQTSPGDTPIARWQFQTSFPSYANTIYLSSNKTVMVGLHYAASGGITVIQPLEESWGGRAVVVRPLASFLRGYQLGGGYTPGPLLAVAALAGLAGALAAARRRLSPAQRDLARGTVAFLGAAVAVLLASDAFEFSWRYQLPALVTLPPAGALGITLIVVAIRDRRRSVTPG